MSVNSIQFPQPLTKLLIAMRLPIAMVTRARLQLMDRRDLRLPCSCRSTLSIRRSTESLAITCRSCMQGAKASWHKVRHTIGASSRRRAPCEPGRRRRRARGPGGVAAPGSDVVDDPGGDSFRPHACSWRDRTAVLRKTVGRGGDRLVVSSAPELGDQVPLLRGVVDRLALGDGLLCRMDGGVVDGHPALTRQCSS